MSAPRAFLRGIVHCHSVFSYDSTISIATYLRFAARHSLDFVILTDHDSSAGSAALRRAAAKRLPQIEVPIAAEYKTDEGDVIAVFLRDELRAESYSDFVRLARAQDALLLLPHPFVAHRNPELLAEDCDLIEVYNSRAGHEQNERAAALARAAKKRGYAASDAHFSRGLERAILEVENMGGLRESLLCGELRWPGVRQTPKWEIHLSQFVKAFKRRDAKLARRIVRSLARAIPRKLRGGG